MSPPVGGGGGVPGGGGDPDKLDRTVMAIASVVILGTIMSVLDTTIVNVALETLSRELHSPLSTIQWVSTGYLLALAIVIPLTGWASERFGGRRLWITVVALFVTGSALCGLAWSAGSLIAFRLLQGFGGGMIMPAGMSLLAQAAGPQRMGRVMSVVGVPMLLGPVLGPVLGGLITQNLSWRWIFYVNVPIGAVALFMAVRLLPNDRPSGLARPRLDLRGLLLLSPGLGAIVYGLSESSSRGGFGDPRVLVAIAAGLVLVAAFVVHGRRRGANALLDLRLFSRPGFAAASATTFLLGAALFGALLVLPLYYQVARGQDVLHAGLLTAPQGIGAALVMPVAGRLVDRVGGGRVVVFGLVVMILGTLGFTQLGPRSSETLLAGFLLVRGIGLGSSMMPAMAAAYATVDRAAVPRATTLLNVGQRLGGSLGSALLAVILESRIKHAVPAVGHVPAGLPTGAALPAGVRAHVAGPLAEAFAGTFWWAVALSLVALAPALVLAWTARRPRDAGAAARPVAA